MKLKDYANSLGVSYKTAYYMFHRGEIPNSFQLPSGTILIKDEVIPVAQVPKEPNVAIYTRVSSSENKANLQSQADRLISYAAAKGYKIHSIIKEVGSGVNDNRKLLTSLLQNKEIDIILVEHKDRLTRFGFNYIKILMEQLGKSIEVVNESTDQTGDIIQDFISIITSFCARIYGKRRSKRTTEKLIEELKQEPK